MCGVSKHACNTHTVRTLGAIEYHHYVRHLELPKTISKKAPAHINSQYSVRTTPTYSTVNIAHAYIHSVHKPLHPIGSVVSVATHC